jgi:hypothetical protein
MAVCWVVAPCSLMEFQREVYTASVIKAMGFKGLNRRFGFTTWINYTFYKGKGVWDSSQIARNSRSLTLRAVPEKSIWENRTRRVGECHVSVLFTHWSGLRIVGMNILNVMCLPYSRNHVFAVRRKIRQKLCWASWTFNTNHLLTLSTPSNVFSAKFSNPLNTSVTRTNHPRDSHYIHVLLSNSISCSVEYSTVRVTRNTHLTSAVTRKSRMEYNFFVEE